MSYMAVNWPAAQQKQKFLEDLLVEYGMTANSRLAVNPPPETAVRQDTRMQPSVVVKTEPQTMPTLQAAPHPPAQMQLPTFPQQQDAPMMTRYNSNDLSKDPNYIDPILAVQHMSMSSTQPMSMYLPPAQQQQHQQQQQPLPQYSMGNFGQNMHGWAGCLISDSSPTGADHLSSQSIDASTQPAHARCQSPIRTSQRH